MGLGLDIGKALFLDGQWVHWCSLHHYFSFLRSVYKYSLICNQNIIKNLKLSLMPSYSIRYNRYI